MSVDIVTLARERDFLWRLLHLADHDKPAELIHEALGTAVSFAGARGGFLELTRDDRSVATSSDGIDAGAVRALLASTAVASRLDDGLVAVAGPAGGASPVPLDGDDGVTDEVVVCVPIGRRPRDGVLVLEGVAPDVATASPTLWALFGRQIASLAPGLFRHSSLRAADPTSPWRSRLGGGDGVVGASQALAETLKAAASAAMRDVAVLITGPHGSGKSTLARLIAQHGPRGTKPVVVVDAGQLDGLAADEELFGIDGPERVVGKVEAADGGTLFVEEIARLSLPVQAKLVQLLVDGTFYPVGASRAQHADVRIIATSRFDLAGCVRQGLFREDLFYRLCVIEIPMPTLDERRIDIAPLADHFLREAISRHALSPTLAWSTQALRSLETATWPGNLRQLQSVVEGAAVRAHAEGSRVVESAHVFPNQRDPDARSTFQAMMRGYQRQVLTEALARHHGNVSEAAAALGLGRSSLYQLIKNLGIERT